MSITLYQATIPSFLQILDSVIELMKKGEAHCTDNNLPESELIKASIHEDMLPLDFQITMICHQSRGAIEGVQRGHFSPVRDVEENFTGLISRLTGAREMLAALTEDEVNALANKPLKFTATGFEMDFDSDEFLFTFSLPNFYFHATTAYNILRMKGLNIGKLDFLGKMRTK